MTDKTESVSARPLTENDIRPEHLNAAKEAAYARDVERLLRRRAEFVEIPCPACGDDAPNLRWTKYDLRYQQCPTCATIYVSPRPTPDILEEYYTTSELYEYWNKFIFPASEEARRQRIFRPRVARLLEICERYASDPQMLVEVGPGFGTFCEEASATGRFKRIVAIEPSPSLADTCRRKGIEVIERPIEQVNLGAATADVVASFEVIEHLFDPRGFLDACARALSPGGILVLTCPNGQGFEVQVLEAVADTVDTEHLNYFNPDSLTRLVSSAGFDVLEATTPGLLDADIVRNKVLAGKFDLTGQPFLRIALLDRWEELGGAISGVSSSESFLVAHVGGRQEAEVAYLGAGERGVALTPGRVGSHERERRRSASDRSHRGPTCLDRRSRAAVRLGQ